MADGKVKGFFKNIGKKIDDAQLESNIKSSFKSGNKEFGAFKGAKLFEISSFTFYAEDHLSDGYILALANDEITEDCLLEESETNKVFYINSVEKTELTIAYDGIEYKRDGVKILVGEEAKKVDVIKVGDFFYEKKNK